MSGRRKCEFEAAGPVTGLLEKYDPKADTWDVPRDGIFWETVKAAHAEGLRGKGKKIAILDSPCDYRLPRIKKQTGGGPRRPGPFGEPADHGTLVALLVGAVAPDCAIDIYEITRNGKPDLNMVIAALDQGAESDVDIVCLSLGVPTEINLESWMQNAAGLYDRTQWASWLESDELPELLQPEKKACPLCEAADKNVAAGKMVFAAVGNSSGDIFCPARAKGVTSVGFQLEQRTFEKVSQGGLWEPAFWAPPSYSQSILADVTVNQLSGALGSSFACPLIAGAAALGIQRDHLGSLLKSARLSGNADALLPMLDASHPREWITLTRSLYSRALDLHPYKDLIIEDAMARLECRIFSVPLFVNYGLFLMGIDNLKLAEELLRTVWQFAPWEASAAANLGRLCQIKAERTYSSGWSAELARDFLAEAEALYIEALRLRPGMKVFEYQLAEIRALMREWR
jgi:hypothetical protein